MKIDSIIFDLDGTLWDASGVTARGWNKVLEESTDIDTEISDDQVRAVSGLPFSECISKTFGTSTSSIDLNSLETLLDKAEKDAFQTENGILYSGVISGIKEISLNFRLFIVSNCQSWYLDEFWKQFGLKQYFEYGTCYGDENKSKHEMISALISSFSLTNPIYVGDTYGDAISASNAGVKFVHAEYGFGAVIDSVHSISTFTDLLIWCNAKVT